VPGRGYLERYEYDGEERPMTVLDDDQEDVNMLGPSKLRYVTFRHGELTYWGEKVED
jgi:hypothetical protein